MEYCRNCAFWARIPNPDLRRQVGMCRRRAPVPILVGHISVPDGGAVPIVNGYFPETRPDIWCGDFEKGVATDAVLPDVRLMATVGGEQ